jgi:multidrug efflux pump subunit AcrA (membrane-fusion protein)
MVYLKMIRSGLLMLAMAQAAYSAEPIATATVEYREVDITFAAEAVIEAVRQSTVSAQVAGRIVEVNYDVGDYVKKGQVIVRIDQAEARQIVAGSEAQVAQARAAYENARVALERSRQLAAQKFISQAALDKTEAEFRVAEAQLKAAMAGAGQAATTKAYTVGVAPYSGVVAARHVELGEMASPNRIRSGRHAGHRHRAAIQSRGGARQPACNGRSSLAQQMDRGYAHHGAPGRGSAHARDHGPARSAGDDA